MTSSRGVRPVWTVRLGRQAEQDYVEILQWTIKIFGIQQAGTYAETMARAIEAFEDGPDVLRLLHDSMDLPRHLPAADERQS